MPTAPRPVLKLIVPGFMQSLDDSTVRMPALERLLAYGSHFKQSTAYRSHEAWHGELVDALGLGDLARYASAPMCWLGLGGSRSPGVWLHVDPVRMDFSAGGMTMRSSPAWPSEHLQTIAAVFRHHLESTDLRLHELGNQLYAHAPSDLSVDTASVQYALSQPPRAALPVGRDSTAVRRLMTELQMLLNERFQEAESAGAGRSNSVWLWGAGPIPSNERHSLPPIWTHEHFARGIYALNDTSERCLPLPATAAGVFEQDAFESIVVVRGRVSANLDAQLFAPALDSLHRGRYASIDLFLDGRAVRVEPSLWRRLFARTQRITESLQ